MKIAVVYYSFDGNSAVVAAQLAERLNVDTIRIKLKDEKKRRGFFKFFWGGAMVVFNKIPELKPLTFDPAAYDLIILGAPVWAGSLAPPMKGFLSSAKITGKKIALYTCYGGDSGKSLDDFKALLSGNEIISETGFKNPARGNPDELKQQIDGWVKQIAGSR